MDYEQWTPLGRGDPLKNDPTYDYVPPVLERVHYWIDPALRKPDPPIPGENQKTEILLLGVSSKKPSTGTSVADSRRDTYEPFMKFVDGPKFQSSYQRISRPHHYSFPATYFSSPYHSAKNKPEKNAYANKSEQRMPYTMLVPPPVPKKTHSSESIPLPVGMFASSTSSTSSKPPTTASSTTESSVTFQESNLVYQSSSLGGLSEWSNDQNHYASYAAPSSQVTWKTPVQKPQNASKNELIPSPEQFLEFHYNNSGDQKENITFNVSPSVLPVDLDGSGIMYKGQVSDGDMDIASTYVNIGKPEAQMDSSSGFGISSVSMEPPQIIIRQPPILMRPHISITSLPSIKKSMHPITLQTIETMQTMQPPPVSMRPEKRYTPTSTLFSLLRKEVTKPFSITPSTFFAPTPLPEMFTTTTPTPSSTTTSLTTDPLFKHYKQPSEPLRGPMYLIIQGHSKVKTYGPSKQVHGISVQETNEVLTTDEKNKYSVKHLHGFKGKETNEERAREGRSSNLQSLSHVVQTGLGAIDYASRRMDEDVQETELGFSYDVSSRHETSSEKYHKGIVEAARKMSEDVVYKQK